MGWDKDENAFFMGKTLSTDGYFNMSESSNAKLYLHEISSNLINVIDIVANDISVNETRVSKIKIDEYAYFGDYDIDNAFLGWDNTEKTFVMGKFNTEENEFDTTDMIDVKLKIGEINSNSINVTDIVANDISVNETIVSRINITNYAYYGDFEIDNAFLGWDR